MNGRRLVNPLICDGSVQELSDCFPSMGQPCVSIVIPSAAEESVFHADGEDRSFGYAQDDKCLNSVGFRQNILICSIPDNS